MQYLSTRGQSPLVSGAEAIVRGLAPDGGLYMPQVLPSFDARSCLSLDPYAMAQTIASAFFPDIPEMEKLVRQAYQGKFTREDLTPTVNAGPFSVLELFHGPTSAFKDIALSMLPQLLTAARRQTGAAEDVLILTATSGDTGKAALEGFQDVEGIRICVFYPKGGVSKVQQAQMVTQEGKNVTVCAVEGNFDDAQTGVKQIFSSCRQVKAGSLSSANSINIGRLVPQILYYFKAYRDLLDRGQITMGQEVNFSVPTGNFGDILAGYLAKRLGLPVGMLICASNANNILTDFIRTGVYDRRRPLYKTQSPSMDILVSSNLERLLYLVTEDPAFVRERMEALSRDGCYQIGAALLGKIQGEFWAGCCDDAQAKEVIGRIWREHQYLCDPHTAAGWFAAEDYVNQTGDQRPMVVLSTASAYKFPAAVLEALGCEKETDEFDQMAQLEQVTGWPIPRNLRSLRGKPPRHTGVIRKEDMLEFVKGL